MNQFFISKFNWEDVELLLRNKFPEIDCIEECNTVYYKNAEEYFVQEGGSLMMKFKLFKNPFVVSFVFEENKVLQYVIQDIMSGIKRIYNRDDKIDEFDFFHQSFKWVIFEMERKMGRDPKVIYPKQVYP